MLLGDRHNPVHVRGNPQDMDRHNRSGSLGNSLFDLVRVDLEGLGIRVSKDRQGTGADDNIVSGDKRIR